MTASPSFPTWLTPRHTWPLQAPRQSIEKYEGVYDAGYEALKKKRLQALKDRGLVAADLDPFPRFPDEPAWDSLGEEEKRYQARLMEIYAAMVDDVDVHIGRIIAHLKAIGEYDNTFIFFTSDNGPESHNLGESWEGLAEFLADCCDNSYEKYRQRKLLRLVRAELGSGEQYATSHVQGFYNPGRHTRTGVCPLSERHRKGPAQRLDVACDGCDADLDGIGGREPSRYKFPGPGSRQHEGENPCWRCCVVKLARRHADDHVFGWELFTKRALRKGDWKIVYEPFHEVLEPRVSGIKTDTWQNLQSCERSGGA